VVTAQCQNPKPVDTMDPAQDNAANRDGMEFRNVTHKLAKRVPDTLHHNDVKFHGPSRDILYRTSQRLKVIMLTTNQRQRFHESPNLTAAPVHKPAHEASF